MLPAVSIRGRRLVGTELHHARLLLAIPISGGSSGQYPVFV